MPLIKCPTCGKAKVDLAKIHPVLSETLETVFRMPGATAPEYASLYIGVSDTSMNQRLERLRQLNFVRRERKSRGYGYWPT